jgi:hypothetical protein
VRIILKTVTQQAEMLIKIYFALGICFGVPV